MVPLFLDTAPAPTQLTWGKVQLTIIMPTRILRPRLIGCLAFFCSEWKALSVTLQSTFDLDILAALTALDLHLDTNWWPFRIWDAWALPDTHEWPKFWCQGCHFCDALFVWHIQKKGSVYHSTTGCKCKVARLPYRWFVWRQDPEWQFFPERDVLDDRAQIELPVERLEEVRGCLNCVLGEPSNHTSVQLLLYLSVADICFSESEL